ncbi:hypothetical protein D3C77_551680 [compost metagenome]
MFFTVLFHYQTSFNAMEYGACHVSNIYAEDEIHSYLKNQPKHGCAPLKRLLCEQIQVSLGDYWIG